MDGKERRKEGRKGEDRRGGEGRGQREGQYYNYNLRGSHQKLITYQASSLWVSGDSYDGTAGTKLCQHICSPERQKTCLIMWFSWSTSHPLALLTCSLTFPFFHSLHFSTLLPPFPSFSFSLSHTLLSLLSPNIPPSGGQCDNGSCILLEGGINSSNGSSCDSESRLRREMTQLIKDNTMEHGSLRL